MRAIGIDLGTTYSSVATLTPAGRTAVLVNERGESLIPSIVHFGPADVVVGHEALKAAVVDPEGAVVSAKRDTGQAVYRRPVRGRWLPTEVIQAYLLRHLKQIIDLQVRPPYRAVIAVPAFFDERRRKATLDAGQMAGLDVLDIVNEPTAAALAFGEQLGYLDERGNVDQELRVLVFDLGGGTFDVTLVELGPHRFVTRATDGDALLGGDDWDRRLAEYAAQKFEAACGLDPRDDPLAMARLTRVAEEAKRTLSVRGRTVMELHHGGRFCEIPITQTQLEGLTADLLERTAHTCSELLQAVKLSWSDIDHLLLVGGATRMPMVTHRLLQLSGIAPEQIGCPDEAVSRGASLYAAYRLSREGWGEMRVQISIVDVSSYSLGVEGVDLFTGRRRNSILIPRHTPLPVQVTQRFVTRQANQESVVLKVLQGEHPDPDECSLIGRATLRQLPPGLRRGHPLEVTYVYAANGRLRVQLRVDQTDRFLEMELDRPHGMSDERLADWQRVICSGGGYPDFEAMLESVLGISL